MRDRLLRHLVHGFTAIVLLVAVACSPATPPGAQTPAVPVHPAEAGTARQLSSGSPAPTTITILHTNDIHGALEGETVGSGGPPVTRGGLANLVGYIHQARAARDGRVLVLDAGDAWSGTFISNISRGKAVVQAMNAAGYDAMALGNHDFDWGQETVRERAREATFPFLGANIQEASTGQLFAPVKAYLVKRVGNVRVGVLGLTNPGTPAITKPENVRGLRFLSAMETVARYLPQLRQEADLIVVLSHMGVADDERLARSAPGIDVIVGGHSHTQLHEPLRFGQTIYVQAGSSARFVGQLELVVDREGRIVSYTREGELVEMVSTRTTPDRQVASMVAAYAQQAKVEADRVVGETLVDLEPAYSGECLLCNLVADAMREADMGDGRVADLAFHNLGGIRASIPKGPIRYAQLYEVLPFDNRIVSMYLTGQQIMNILGRAVSASRVNAAISGFSFTYDQSRRQGPRIVSVEVAGRPLDAGRSYRVVTTDYLASGGDGQEEFKNGRELVYGDLLVDVVARYVSSHSPLRVQLEGRIRSASR